ESRTSVFKKVVPLSGWVRSSVFISKTTTTCRYLLRSGSTVEGQSLPLALLLPSSFGFADRCRRWPTHERPDLLGDPPPVRGGVQATEHGVKAEVDPLQDHVSARHIAVGGQGSLGVEEPAHDRRRISRGDGHRRIAENGLVEEPEA